MRRRWLTLVLVILAVAAVIVVWRVVSAPAAPKPTAQPRAIPVGFAAAERRDVPMMVEGLGNVTSLATVTVRARVSGQIVSFAFKEGAAVKKGEALVKIDPRPFQIALEQAQATLQRDTALLRNAELDLHRFEQLVVDKLIAQQQRDEQRAVVEQARATVALDRAAVDNARLNLQFTSVTSPIDGVAGVRQVDVGNLVTPTDTGGIVVLTQMDPIAVLFTLPQDDLARVADASAKGPLTIEAFDRGGGLKLGDGKLTVIDNQIVAGTATMRLKAELDNPARRLWPSLFVKVRLLLETRRGALVVPTAALQNGPSGTFVYLIRPDNTVTVRALTVDSIQGPQALVARGVDEGDRVVTDGQNQLRDGARVDPRPVASGVARGESP